MSRVSVRVFDVGYPKKKKKTVNSLCGPLGTYI